MLLVMILLLGCASKAHEETKIGELAKELVIQSDEYKNLDGENPIIAGMREGDCQECMEVTIEFDSYDIAGGKGATAATVLLRGSELVSMEFERIIKPRFTIDEAIAFATGTDCTERGELTDSYHYNKSTGAWWIGLNMKKGFEREGCNAVCVVSENPPDVMIYWRCKPAKICKDLCGNGQCEEVVCLGTGCPCAETKANCPVDCH